MCGVSEPNEHPGLLLTAFEPSGDALAGPVIAKLRGEFPSLPIHALGGPKMKAAGAEVLEITTEHAAMHGDAIKQAWSHRQRVKRLQAWLRDHPVALHLAVDSPAANWAICKSVRRAHPNAKITHLAAPQLWAWAPGRIRKLRRLTDHVLCLLPFEPAWFEQRGVKASFVGHPLLEQIDQQQNDWSQDELPDGPLKLALLPGSRSGEVQRNARTMLDVAAQLQMKHEGLTVVIATPSDGITASVQALLEAMPDEGLKASRPVVQIEQGRADDVLHWADVALLVSGTATLQTAGHATPMVAMYNLSRIKWHGIGRWLVKTRTFTLPNLISEAMGKGRVIQEFVPHFGQVEPIAAAVDALLSDDAARADQAEDLSQITAPFNGLSYVNEVVGHVHNMLEDLD